MYHPFDYLKPYRRNLFNLILYFFLCCFIVTQVHAPTMILFPTMTLAFAQDSFAKFMLKPKLEVWNGFLKGFDLSVALLVRVDS